MIATVGDTLAAIPDAVALGVRAMGFDSGAFRRVGIDGHSRDLAFIVVYLAGLSQAIGNGVVLFLNRVQRVRFVLSLALMAAIFVAGALITAAASVLVANLAFGRSLEFVPTLAVIALAYSPRLLGTLTLAPYFGEMFDRLLDVWVLTLVLFGLHHGLGLGIEGAALLALLGWGSTRLLLLLFGRPLTAFVDVLRRTAAGSPLTLDSRNLAEALKAAARAAGAPPDRK